MNNSTTNLAALIEAAIVFDGDVTGSNRPLYGQGIRFVTKSSTGIYIVTFEDPLPTDHYIVQVTPSQERVCWISSKTKESFTITCEDNASAAADTTNVYVLVILW